MMPELEPAIDRVPPPAWPAAARRVARTAAVMFVGASAFAFWMLVWEPPAGVEAPGR